MGTTAVTLLLLSALVTGNYAYLGKGGIVFRDQCVLCHGKHGNSTTVAPAMRDNAWVREANDQEIFDVIRDGRYGDEKRYKERALNMPAHPDLKDAHIREIVKYLKKISEKEIIK